MRTQFVTDSKGEKIAVILPIKSYQQMVERLEEQDDIRLYDQARAEGGTPVPLEKYLKNRALKSK